MLLQDPIPGSDDLPASLEAVGQLVEVLVRSFGAGGTVALIFGLMAVAIGWRLYQQWRKDREVNAVVAEKDKTIQRLADESRMWRAMFLKEQGWTDQQVDQFVLRNEFSSPAESRRILERENPAQSLPSKSAKPRRRNQ